MAHRGKLPRLPERSFPIQRFDQRAQERYVFEGLPSGRLIEILPPPKRKRSEGKAAWQKCDGVHSLGRYCNEAGCISTIVGCFK